MDFDLPALCEQLIQAFDDSELQHLCFELNVDYEIINGTNKQAKARELLTYLDRRRRIPELVVYCQRKRPNYHWNLVLSQQRQNEEFRQQLHLDTSFRAKYLDERFEVYRNVWQSLYALKMAGDKLWSRASKENLLHFAASYQQVQGLVMINAIIFTEEDYHALKSVLLVFGRFRVGKARLVDLREDNDESMRFLGIDRIENSWIQGQVISQIEANRAIKSEYNALLERISAGFRRRIAELAP